MVLNCKEWIDNLGKNDISHSEIQAMPLTTSSIHMKSASIILPLLQHEYSNILSVTFNLY